MSRPKVVNPPIAAEPQGGGPALDERLLPLEARVAAIEGSTPEMFISERKVLDMRTGRTEEMLQRHRAEMDVKYNDLVAHTTSLDLQLRALAERIASNHSHILELDTKFHECYEEDLAGDDGSDDVGVDWENLESRLGAIQVQVKEMRQAFAISERRANEIAVASAIQVVRQRRLDVVTTELVASLAERGGQISQGAMLKSAQTNRRASHCGNKATTSGARKSFRLFASLAPRL